MKGTTEKSSISGGSQNSDTSANRFDILIFEANTVIGCSENSQSVS